MWSQHTTVNSQHLRNCFENTGRWSTLVTTNLWFLEHFLQRSQYLANNCILKKKMKQTALVSSTESVTDAASGRRGRAVPITTQALPSAASLLNKLGSVRDWESLVFTDFLSKPHGRAAMQDDKLTWRLLVGYLPWQIESALFPTKGGGCRAAHHLHLLEWGAKRCRGSGTTKAACELHTGMSCVGVAFLFPMRGSD